MAGMNVEEKEDMSRFILDVNGEFGTTIALIEHDMGVVMDISDRVAVLDYGRKIADGPPEHVRKDAAVLHAHLGPGPYLDSPRGRRRSGSRRGGAPRPPSVGAAGGGGPRSPCLPGRARAPT